MPSRLAAPLGDTEPFQAPQPPISTVPGLSWGSAFLISWLNFSVGSPRFRAQLFWLASRERVEGGPEGVEEGGEGEGAG